MTEQREPKTVCRIFEPDEETRRMFDHLAEVFGTDVAALEKSILTYAKLEGFIAVKGGPDGTTEA